MSRYTLEIRSGDGAPRSVPLPDDRATTLGRSRENDVVLPQGLVSGRHAVIEPGAGGPLLRDLDSTNGTFLNGVRIEGPARLAGGDRIRMGRIEILLEEGESGAPPGVTFVEGERGAGAVFAQIDTGQSVILDGSLRAETFRALETANRNLAVLTEMGRVLLEAKDEDDVCARLLDLLFDVLPADRAAVLLRGPDGELEARAARVRKRGRPLAVSRSILGRCMEEGLSLLTADAGADERFRGERSVILQGIRAAMCAPLRGRGAVLGALYADSGLRAGAFREQDLELLTTLGIQGGIAVENRRLAEESLRAERLAAIGAVVAGLGHDIRNILAALRGGAYVMDRVVAESDDPDLAEAWDIVKGGTDTISDLVTDMVSYSKERRPTLRPTDLNALAARVATRFAARANETGATLTTALDPKLPPVPAEAAGIDRVLSNLVSNALDALGERGGAVTVRTALAGDAAEIAVRDDGPGVPPEHRDRIFDLLFSTKGSQGTGFGLAVSRKVVAEHGGALTLDPPGKGGATFRIRLPLAPGPGPEAEGAGPG